MTLSELAVRLGKSENTLKHQFQRTKKTLEKKGIIINKHGIGEYADYTIEYINKN